MRQRSGAATKPSSGAADVPSKGDELPRHSVFTWLSIVIPALATLALAMDVEGFFTRGLAPWLVQLTRDNAGADSLTSLALKAMFPTCARQLLSSGASATATSAALSSASSAAATAATAAGLACVHRYITCISIGMVATHSLEAVAVYFRASKAGLSGAKWAVHTFAVSRFRSVWCQMPVLCLVSSLCRVPAL
jgi:hypothetical protein